MFESKKFLAILVALVLVGSVAGSIVAYKLWQQKTKNEATETTKAEPAKPVESTPAPKPETKPEPVVAKEEPVKEEAPAPLDIQPDFKILTRQEWKARAPVKQMKDQTPKFITIHHTGVKQTTKLSLPGKLRSLQDFSQHESVMGDGKSKPVWPDIPNHFYIDLMGDVGEGCNINYVGDFKETYNTMGHISVVVEGNFESEQPTPEQMNSLAKVISWLSRKYHIPANKINTHKAYAATGCPGKNLESRLSEIRLAAAQ